VTIRWTQVARERLNGIIEYIAEDDPAAARRWSESLFHRVEKLQTFPEMGRVVPEVGKREVREVFHGDYRVIYKVRRREVLVLTIRHGRRLFDRTEVE
jgi:plasmid stabilization system protein ParE